MNRNQKELGQFFEQLGFKNIKLDHNVTIKQLKEASKEELHEILGDQINFEDFLVSLENHKDEIKNYEPENRPRKDDIDTKLVFDSQAFNSSKILRRHSTHKECMNRFSRVHRPSLVSNDLLVSQSKVSCIRGVTNLLKTRHLGHSAPDIFYSSKPVSEHQSFGDFSKDKLTKYRHVRPSFPSTQFTTRNNEASPRQMDSPKMSSVLQQLHLRNSRRMSMNSFVSSEFSFQLSPSSAFSSHDSSQDKLNESLSSDYNGNTESMSANFNHFYNENKNPFNSIPKDQFRPRARSFNSPAESEPDIISLNEFYKDCFPKARKEAESKLENFIETHSSDQNDSIIKSDGFGSFVLQQLIQLANDCLVKSQENMLSSTYLASMVANMQGLLETAQTKAGASKELLAQITQDLLLIICRPARLLECLEFEPGDFYRRLEAVEGEVRNISDEDVVGYLLKQLSLEKQLMEDKMVNDHREKKLTNLTERSVHEVHLRAAIKADQPLSSHPPSYKDFETVKLISNGAYGAVLLVRHIESKRLYAMKKLRKENLLLRNMVNQVFTERDILTFIDNPFVVSFYCSFETKRHLCMILEYIEGGDCAALLKNIQGPLPCDMARLYFAETVMALEYLHNFGIVHRDLKPDNLLITSIGHIKLTDFGLSKIGLMKMTTSLYEGSVSESRRFTDCQVFGTPEYIAPEVILKNQYGKPVDWWAMGVILYEFLVGCVPFTGDSPDQVFSEIILGELEWPEEEEWMVGEDAEDLIKALLQRQPEVRLGSDGATEVKQHRFLTSVDWNGLLRQKTQFVPDLSGEDDTSYFDDRNERYNHKLDDEDDDDDTTCKFENSLFDSFTTCSPKFNKQQPIIGKTEDSEDEKNVEKERERMKQITKERKQRRERDKNPRKIPVKNSSYPIFNKNVAGSADFTATGLPKDPHRRFSLKNELIGKYSSFNETMEVNRSLGDNLSNFESTSSTEDPVRDVVIVRGKDGYGFNFRGIKSFDHSLNKHVYQHIIMLVEKGSPAWKAGLKAGDCISHVNHIPLETLNHSQAVKLMLIHQKKESAKLKGIRKKNLSKKIFKMSRIEDADWYESDESVVDNKTSTNQSSKVEKKSKVNTKDCGKIIPTSTNSSVSTKKAYKGKEVCNSHNVVNTSTPNKHDYDAFNNNNKYAPVLTSNNIYDNTNIINIDKNITKEQTIVKTPTSSSKSKGLKGIVKRALRWHSRVDEKASRWYFDAPQSHNNKTASANHEADNNESVSCSENDLGSSTKNNTLVKDSTLVDLENLKIGEKNLDHNQNNSFTVDASKETSNINLNDGTPDDSIESPEVIFSSGDTKLYEKDDEKDSGVDGSEMAMRKGSIAKRTLSDGAYNPITLTVIAGAGKKLVRTAGKRISIARRRPSEIYRSIKAQSSPRGSMNNTVLPVLGNSKIILKPQKTRIHNKLGRPSTLSLTRRVSMGCYPLSPLVLSSSPSQYKRSSNINRNSSMISNAQSSEGSRGRLHGRICYLRADGSNSPDGRRDSGCVTSTDCGSESSFEKTYKPKDTHSSNDLKSFSEKF